MNAERSEAKTGGSLKTAASLATSIAIKGLAEDANRADRRPPRYGFRY
jgi:hypothetical protein